MDINIYLHQGVIAAMILIIGYVAIKNIIEMIP